MLQAEKFNLSCQILSSHNLQGKLVPDSNGHFKGIVLGALNFKNSYGAIYTPEGGRALVSPTSSFSRRQKEGHAKGEYGHPKRTSEYSDDDAWMNRIMTIEETRMCHDHLHTWIDLITDRRTGQKVLCFIGDIAPFGPYAETLERDLQRNASNCAFSIRSITDDFRLGGLHTKNIIDATGFDFVCEPGLSVATKFQSPALESFAFTKGQLEELISKGATDTISMESCNKIKELLVSIESRTSNKTTIFQNHKPSRFIGA